MTVGFLPLVLQQQLPMALIQPDAVLTTHKKESLLNG